MSPAVRKLSTRLEFVKLSIIVPLVIQYSYAKWPTCRVFTCIYNVVFHSCVEFIEKKRERERERVPSTLQRSCLRSFLKRVCPDVFCIAGGPCDQILRYSVH